MCASDQPDVSNITDTDRNLSKTDVKSINSNELFLDSSPNFRWQYNFKSWMNLHSGRYRRSECLNNQIQFSKLEAFLWISNATVVSVSVTMSSPLSQPLIPPQTKMMPNKPATAARASLCVNSPLKMNEKLHVFSSDFSLLCGRGCLPARGCLSESRISADDVD